MGFGVKEVTFTGTIDSVTSQDVKKRRSNKEIDSEIKALKDEREANAMHEQNLDAAKLVYDLYESYIEAGFDEEQAWELLTIMLKKNI